MKILITGANGMLAKAVRERFKNETLILTDVVQDDTIKKLDITNLEDVTEFVSNCKPDVIINCAAYTAVDKAEEDLDLARKINADGPKNLAIAAKNANCILVHISTDYVFGGNLSLEEIYKEDDEKAPETVYGKTKLEGEEAITANTEKYYIFRTAWLYGDGKNFVRTMLNAGREKEKLNTTLEDAKKESLNVVSDQHGSPTYAVDLADIIAQALEKEIPYGIYHATNLGFTTWYDFTKEILKMANIFCKVNPVTSEEFVRPAKRPKNSMMSKSKLLDAGVTIPFWEDALERYLKVELEKD